MFVCAHALKRQWVGGKDVVQIWQAGEQQKELKKNSDTENPVILNVSIVTKWLGFTWGKTKGLSRQKMYWSQKHGTEWVRLSESGGIWYYRLRFTQEETDHSGALYGFLHLITVLILYCSFFLSLWCIYFLESLTHLIVWPKRDLTTFPDMTHQY